MEELLLLSGATPIGTALSDVIRLVVGAGDDGTLVVHSMLNNPFQIVV